MFLISVEDDNMVGILTKTFLVLIRVAVLLGFRYFS